MTMNLLNETLSKTCPLALNPPYSSLSSMHVLVVGNERKTTSFICKALQTEGPRIFEQFFSGDACPSKAAESCDWGLSVAQWIVQARPGTMAVASDPGQTTVFAAGRPLEMPFAQLSSGAIKRCPESASSLAGYWKSGNQPARSRVLPTQSPNKLNQSYP
jgi:hypothetical protein